MRTPVLLISSPVSTSASTDSCIHLIRTHAAACTIDLLLFNLLMTTHYGSFAELEQSVPLAQLLPSLAFSRCAAPLPPDVDELHGAELIRSLEAALLVHSKARVVLQCWVLLIMRRRCDRADERDELYGRVLRRVINPQERARQKHGCMLLCHLLKERDEAGEQSSSLLDLYLQHFYFAWSSAVNDRLDAFYLQEDVAHTVRLALTHFQQTGTKITAKHWLSLNRPLPSPPPAQEAPPTVASPPLSPDQQALEQLAAVATEVAIADEPAPLALRTRSKDGDRTVSTPSPSGGAEEQQPSPSPAACRKRRRAGQTAGGWSEPDELEKLKATVERWAKRLRCQLLQAARSDDKAQIHQVADLLQAPPLSGDEAEPQDGEVVEQAEEDDSREAADAEDDSDDGPSAEAADHSGDELRSHPLPTLLDDRDSSSPSATPSPDPAVLHVLSPTVARGGQECSVCESEPKRVEQVWSSSCLHGFCSHCMLARLSKRERQCMYCRVKISSVVDATGSVLQHYDWVKQWRTQLSAAS